MSAKGNAAWHARARERDRQDIAAGKATPHEINQRNAVIPNAAEWKIVDMAERLRDLYEEEDAYGNNA